MSAACVDVLVIGGGPAGAAAAAWLAAAGLRVMVYERNAESRPQVCGEYLSAAAAAELEQLGLAPAELGARPLSHACIRAQGSDAELRLPTAGHALSRGRLDRSLLEHARRRGAAVRVGISVRSLERRQCVWSATLADGSRFETPAVVLATGKHDLRGHGRRTSDARPVVGFKMHCRLAADQTAALGNAVELFLFEGGYAGLQPIETGVANLCFIMPVGRVRRGSDAWAAALGQLQRVAPTLAVRLRAASPLWPRPATIARVPYGYFCADRAAPEQLYRVGDQAAVIPSFTGEGIAIALRSARLAAAAMLAGEGADGHAAALRRDFGLPLRRAALLGAAIRHCQLRTIGLRLATFPGVASSLARVSRLDPAWPFWPTAGIRLETKG